MLIREISQRNDEQHHEQYVFVSTPQMYTFTDPFLTLDPRLRQMASQFGGGGGEGGAGGGMPDLGAMMNGEYSEGQDSSVLARHVLTGPDPNIAEMARNFMGGMGGSGAGAGAGRGAGGQ